MCGIFGTTRPDLWASHRDEVLARLMHRGPDGAGWWQSPDAQAVLGHTRLAIIGLGAVGDQPMTSSDGSITLTYNGEIYNYRELDRAGRSDTAVLANLLAESGPASLARVRGMYAFAGWDRRDGGSFIAGRDRYGIKPLYVLRHETGGVTVASELGALLVLPEARAIDPIGLAQYLSFGHTGPLLTVYERIRKLAPGTVWTWRLSDTRAEASVVHVDPWDGETPADIATLVDDTVRAHLVADVEVGVFLSGGTDSTLLAASAAAQVETLRTFTLSFPDRPAIDESPIAATNARRLGTKHETVPVRAGDLADAAAAVVAAHGEPFGDAASLPLLVLARAAAEHVKVVLTGEGADEVFGGYRRYDVSRQLDRGAVRAARVLTRHLAPFAGRHRSDRPRDRAIEAALWGGGHRGHAALVGADVGVLAPLSRAFLDVDELARSDWEACREADGEARHARRHDLVRWLPNTYLEKADRATMAASLEARVPYLDPAVAAYVHRSGLFGKESLARDLDARLPNPARPDRKKGLAVDLAELLEHPALRRAPAAATDARDGIVQATFGPEVAHQLRARAERSPTTRYRLAMTALWDEWRPRP